MSSDIPPLVPVSSPPLVREKRHYPGEQNNQNQNQDQKKSDNSSPDDQHTEESDDEISQKPVNTDRKNVKTGHIDEYV